MPPRVAIVTSGSLLRPSGGALRVLYQARGLWEAGFRDFTVFSPEPDPRWPFPQERIAAHGPAQFVFAQPRGFSLIHAHQNAGLFLKGRLWADLHGWAPLESGAAWRRHPASPRAAGLYLLSVWAARRLARRCQRLLCASDSVAENVRRRFPNAPCEVLRNCLDPAEFPPRPCAAPVVGVVGGFTSRWGRPALELALQVAAACPGVPFRLVGAAAAAQRDAARRLPNVRLLGEVDETGFKAFFQEVSIALLPYPAWCRGGGCRLKLLQAAAAGLALVSTPAGLEGFTPSTAVRVGTSPAELALQIRQLTDAEERGGSAQALRRQVERDHDYLAEGRRLAQFYQQPRLS